MSTVNSQRSKVNSQESTIKSQQEPKAKSPRVKVQQSTVTSQVATLTATRANQKHTARWTKVANFGQRWATSLLNTVIPTQQTEHSSSSLGECCAPNRYKSMRRCRSSSSSAPPATSLVWPTVDLQINHVAARKTPCPLEPFIIYTRVCCF